MRRIFRVEPTPQAGPINGYTFDEASLSVRQLRRWPTEKVYVFLAKCCTCPATRSMAEAELRRRDAWRSPAGAAFWVSGCALFVSVAALIVSAFG